MDNEGRGKVAPKPVRIVLSAQEFSIINRIAADLDAFRNYAASQSSWKRGLIGNTLTPYIIGQCGQYALEKYLGTSGDSSLKRDGDGGVDLEVNGKTIQI